MADKQKRCICSTGVRTQIAGRGAHVALLDDVMSEEDAFSEAGRRYIKEWYQEVYGQDLCRMAL